MTESVEQTVKLLASVHAEVATCLKMHRRQIEISESKALSEFMATYFDGVEVGRKSILEQFSLCLQLQIPTDWFELLRYNPIILSETQSFCRKFCSIEEHGAKIRLFHNYIAEWLEKYPPNPNVGAEELLIYIQSIYVMAASPEFLLDILLLEQDSISFQPSAPTLMNSDYAPEECPTASGINCYDYLNLMNALSCICRKSSQHELEVEMLQKKGRALYRQFNGACKLKFLSPQNIPSEKKELEECLRQGASIIEVIYFDKMNAFSLKNKWQSDLLDLKEFIDDARLWAIAFCKEKNSIVKLNQHRDRVCKMEEKYASFSHDPLDFLAVLLKAANNSGVVPAIGSIEEDTVSWRISEGFIGETPVNAKKRKEDLQLLYALIDKI